MAGLLRTMLLASTLLLALGAWGSTAYAIGLDQARAQGLVGETARGYIAPVQQATPEITKLVNQVNAGRRAKYQSVSQKTGSTLGQVEALAAQKIFSQIPAGTYVQGSDGRWTRK